MKGLGVIEVACRVSYTLVVANAMGHLLSLAALLVVAMDYPLVLILALPLAYHARLMHRRTSLRHPAAWQGFRWLADDRIQARRVDGQQETGQCLVARQWGAASLQLTVHVSARFGPRFVVLPADSTDADTHRRLRVRTRVRPPQHRDSEADTTQRP